MCKKLRCVSLDRREIEEEINCYGFGNYYLSNLRQSSVCSRLQRDTSDYTVRKRARRKK